MHFSGQISITEVVKIRKVLLILMLVGMLIVGIQSVAAITSLDDWKKECNDNNSILKIEDVDFDDDDIKPGEDIKVDITIENTDNDYDVDDIEMDVYFIKKGGTKQLEDDDEDDIEEEEDFDLRNDDDDSFDYEWTPNQDFDDGDEYTAVVRVKSKDGYENNASLVVCAWDDSESIQFEKEKYELEIFKATVTPTTVECSRNVNLAVGIRNVGEKRIDDAVLNIAESALGIEKIFTLDDIDENPNDDENTAMVNYRFIVAEDARPGLYTLNINLDYRDDRESEFKSVDLQVNNCVTEEPVEEEEEEEPEEEEEDVIVIPPTTQPPVITEPVIPEEPEEEDEEEAQEGSLLQSRWFIGFLVSLELIIIIVAVLLVVMLVRRKA